MNFKRLLTTQTGIFFISVLLGLGLATLFRKVCNDKNCIVFNGPVLDEVEGKIFEEDGQCYTYTLTKETCNSNKKIIDIYKEEKQ
jgi:hypothetical protein|tara:strand:- start:204 stop:458 length:255 start_codon:yes stop_codon:yes gene_type:complete